MRVLCDWCNKEFSIKPSRVEKQYNKFCTRECSWAHKGRNKVKTKCFQCGKDLFLPPSYIGPRNFCSHSCATTARNYENNPMKSQETKSKLSLRCLGSGERKTYPRLNGRHIHRTVAEMVLGRELLPGEVVHHIDGDKRNYSSSNLRIYSSQAEHLAYHLTLRKEMKG